MEKLAVLYQKHDPEQAVAARFVGASDFRRDILKRIKRYARLKAPVLICGESGTGKELVAEALHELGPVADGPFVAVNCGAIPESIAESELFGHSRGAFTGAVNSQTGLFEQAGGGSLLLDEVGELPIMIQSKLLRFLENGMIRRLGDEKTSFVPSRIIAATNRPLESLIAAGQFRLDLFHRLNVLEIRMLPLRERKQDIVALSDHFLKMFCDELGPKTLSETALSKIMGHSWPGNVRELKHTLYRACVNAPRETIHGSNVDICPVPVSPQDPGPIKCRPEPEELLEAYAACKGNLSAASRRTGIPRTTLRDMLRRIQQEQVSAP